LISSIAGRLGRSRSGGADDEVERAAVDCGDGLAVEDRVESEQRGEIAPDEPE
jgi:hypothetical protein